MSGHFTMSYYEFSAASVGGEKQGFRIVPSTTVYLQKTLFQKPIVQLARATAMQK